MPLEYKSVRSDQAPNPIPARGKAIDHFLGRGEAPSNIERWSSVVVSNQNKPNQANYLFTQYWIAWPDGLAVSTLEATAMDMVREQLNYAINVLFLFFSGRTEVNLAS